EMTATIAELMASVTALSFDMDLAAARYGALSDGMPYARIPSETYVEIDGQAARAVSETLAILEDGEWCLVATDGEEQMTLIRIVYPLFAEVDLIEPEFELIEP